MIRTFALLTLLAVFATSCGSSSTDVAQSNDANVESVDTTVPPATTEADSEGSTSVSPESSVSPPTTADEPVPLQEIDSLEDLTALPVKAEWVFDQGVWGASPVGDDKIVMAIQGGIRTLDVDSGEFTDLLLVEDGYDRIEAFILLPHGDSHVSVLADEARNGSVDHVFGIDITEQRVTGRTDGPFRPIGINPERVAIQGTEWDLTTMTEGQPIEDEPNAFLFEHSSADELWTLTLDGQLQLRDPATFQQRESYDLDTSLQILSGVVTGVSPTTVMVRTSVSEWLLVDRESSTIQRVDVQSLTDQFPGDTSIDGGAGLQGARYDEDQDFRTVIRIETGGISRWTLATIDQGSGEITSLLAIADGSFETGWNAFDRPNVFWVGERLFANDHVRRIVEIDIDRLDEDSEPFVDDGLSFLPVLTAEEQEVEVVVGRILDGDTLAVDDQSRAESLSAALLEFVGDDKWFVYDLRIEGDRAWTRVRGLGLIGMPFTFQRTNGEWLLDAEGLCRALAAQGSSCEP